ncbi:MAG: hypothetical protein CW691_05590 [Candidatus Bathyarchaeum sp.]|nr:MAG: hypothetical protein CW691_05590 [Candidatus Bathyarchaeum sp.]
MNSPKPSLLEIYVEILRSMEKLQACSLHTIQHETQVEKNHLARAIVFLEKQDFIRTETVQNQTVYSTTPRGNRVVQYFSRHTQESPKQFNLV